TPLRKLAVQIQESSRGPVTRRVITTDVATLDLTSVEPDPRITPTGGGIDAFGNDVLVMSFRGEFYLYHGADAERPFTPLNIAADNGYDLYREHIARNGLDIPNADTYFRFIDVVYDQNDTAPAVWISHHQWHDDRSCYTLRLSRLALSPGTSLERVSARPEDWEAIYDTVPCLPLDADTPMFEGHFSGGRIVVIGPDAVLMSVGDHGFDGWRVPRMLPQEAGSDYGRILLVHPLSGTATPVSMGHRNPQGLFVTADGSIWSTEHGPRGGDELNLIVEGGNYGWPYVTYGAQYGMSTWPLSEQQNRHDGYVKPVFVWLPSIGISSLIQVHGFLPQWDGDLLVSSLRQQTLHRLRYAEGRVIFDEPIEVRERIRDLDQREDGTIIIWTNAATIMELKPEASVEPDLLALVSDLPDPMRHQALSTIGTCLQCHSASPGGEATSAPDLWDVFGRPIAGTDFGGYSAALKHHSGRWDDATLDAFLTDVQAFAHGSTMGFSGISDDTVRATVIAYLEALQDNAGTPP
ncbi:MAG TPA: PQQ-dependent sugar dehydrogenase, partial [Woeseiaceae bacterium]|nr:PQQ-dependent sugar dehydrogenase [Woeseiaceae bacterium]